jgi:hypothetical protein
MGTSNSYGSDARSLTCVDAASWLAGEMELFSWGSSWPLGLPIPTWTRRSMWARMSRANRRRACPTAGMTSGNIVSAVTVELSAPWSKRNLP